MKVLCIVFLLPIVPLLATNGYFAHGYGILAKGRGGVAVAYSDDTFGGANNPATMVNVGDRIDSDLTLFSPKRKAARHDSTLSGGSYNFTDYSKRDYFLLPGLGYNYSFNNDLSLGVTLYANGGLNTSYVGNSKVPGSNLAPQQCGSKGANLLLGCGALGVDLMQLVLAPVLAIRLDRFSFGVAPLLTYQRLKIEGVQSLRDFSSHPSHVSNNGHDNSYGIGVRFGMLFAINSFFSIGGAYATETWMTRFDKYKGLLAEHGKFNIPQNYSLGIKFTPHEKVSIGFDFNRIFFHTIPSLGNSQLPSANFLGKNQLGTSNASGFGWHNQNVYKLALQVRPIEYLELRAGWNYGRSVIRGNLSDTTLNILAPAVVENHLTAGLSYYFFKGKAELNAFYMHAFKNTVEGPSAFSLVGIPSREKYTMYQNAYGIGFAWKW